MDPELRKFYAALDKCHYDAKNSTYKCMLPSCQENAIKSHIIQKNRYLKNIADEKGKVVEHSMHLSHIRKENDYFKLIHINKSSTVPLFCQKHDHTLFRDFERKNELFNYESNELTKLKYRNISAVIRENEIHKKAYDLINERYNFLPELQQVFDRAHYRIVMRKYFLESKIPPVKALKDEIPYRYIIRELPPIPLAASTQYSCYQSKSTKKDDFDLIMINLLPLRDKTILSYGFPRWKLKTYENSISMLCNGKTSEVLQKVSDDLLINVHHWVCSRNFYNHRIKRRRRVIYDYFRNYKKWVKSQDPLPFNLFLNYEY